MTAQSTLVLGANTVIAEPKCSFDFFTVQPFSFGKQLGLLWLLSLDEHRKVTERYDW